MSEKDTRSNLAARLLFDLACALRISSAPVKVSALSREAKAALQVWAAQRRVSLDALLEPGGAILYDRKSVYCFRFAMRGGYNGVVCVDTHGVLLAEDSRVSV